MPGFKKILVITRQGIGNAVMFTPSLEALRRCMPEATIDACVQPFGADVVFAHHPAVRSIFIIRRGLLNHLRLVRRLRREAYDLIVLVYPSGIKTVLMAWLIGAPRRIGHYQGFFGRLLTLCVPPAPAVHDSRQNLDLLEQAGIAGAGESPGMRYVVTEAERAFAGEFTTRHRLRGGMLIGVHPVCGAYNRSMLVKMWPLENIIALIRSISARHGNARFIVSGWHDEREHIERIVTACGDHCIGIHDLDLARMAALIAQCDIFISVDTGPMHIAAALGVPVLALFGPTDPGLVGPRETKSIVLRSDTPCSPCYEFSPAFGCRKDRNICMTSLAVDEVFAAFERLRGETAHG